MKMNAADSGCRRMPRDAGFQRGGTNKGETLIASTLVAIGFALAVLLYALRHAPEGDEHGDEFHRK
jgi:hypothetical protein